MGGWWNSLILVPVFPFHPPIIDGMAGWMV